MMSMTQWLERIGFSSNGEVVMASKWRRGSGLWMRQWMYSWNVPMLLMGFLLGRAMIMDVVSPFAVAFVAVLFHVGTRFWPLAMLACMGGALTYSIEHAGWMTGLLLTLVGVQKGLMLIGRGRINDLPLVVIVATSAAHVLMLSLEGWTSYSALLAMADVLLSVILTLIFLQSLPFFTARRRQMKLRNEEMISLVILVSSVLTGAMAWEWQGISVAHILAQYMILILALVGGAMVGAAVGVVAGTILCLSQPQAVYQISLLAFAGMLAGLFKEGKRWGVALGFILGSSMLALYGTGATEVWLSLLETGVAVSLFLLTPTSVLQRLRKMVPGTEEYQQTQQDYARRLRDVTSAKIEQLTELFQELADRFREDGGEFRKQDEAYMNRFISATVDQTCRTCHKFEQCWEKQFMKSYQGMSDLMAMVEVGGDQRIKVPWFWAEHCVKAQKVVDSVQERYNLYERDMQWWERLKESNRLVSDQLSGVAEVMKDFSCEIKQETQVLTAQEGHIHQALEELGLSIQQVEVLSLEEGKVEIEVILPHGDALDECRKLVAPLLTEIVGEPIAVHRKVVQGRSAGAVITLGSAQRYEVKTGVAGAAKGGQFLSGDSYCYLNLGTGKYAVAVSDGMGNGHRAQQESNAALQLLRRLLTAGMNEQKAVKTVNSMLNLRSLDEVYATVDLAVVDLNTADARFLKSGGTPGFIKRGREVHKVEAENLPVGIIQDIEVDPVQAELEPGDLIIMMTDGIYDAPHHAANKEAFMKRLIAEIETKDPQGFADCLLEKVIRYHKGEIEDDMTVIVARVQRHTPEWTTIRLPGVGPVERPQAG
ncbi:stage II sporulation protein E [Mechercharimyces sp. CAU 1602]|uniref:stage II sporulation protein E n=1 Tax=Mechercharimyces sp. CAU 1602 TaxID=2973933 RepID=UPI00216383F8|nr:stage II sporulation protein E [Mechercharimyces sp. CAU 1602]MCS1352391.1 stage II sporulation protein E [Mechercharimyces sp. CAU 1602]